MERFRPLVTQTKNFHDPLTGNLAAERNVGSVSEEKLQGKTEDSVRNLPRTNGSTSTFNAKPLGGSFPYLREWELICNCSNSQTIFQWGLKGELASCRFRSICWRRFLKLLPAEASKWLLVLRNKREEYENTRHELMVTPGLADRALDPSLNNPLSQDEQSPWNQYFEDHELKRLIRLDVQRTFPEVDFFQLPRIQDMMVSILFCYARKYPDISYVQGMHEILAPLTFVLNGDHVIHARFMEDNNTQTVLQELMDQAYLEHDSFGLFEVVMSRLRSWYEDSELRSDCGIARPLAAQPAQPFARPQDVGPTTKIVQRLTRIHDVLLKHHEPDIFNHLCRLEIMPQVYGIRWARLMLGREFSLTDLLIVWDAIFADNDERFGLIEYLMVAMMSYIKDEILEGDYITTLNMLMRFPSGADVGTIIRSAFHFRDPEEPLPQPLTYKRALGERVSVPVYPLHNHPSFTRSSSLPRHESSIVDSQFKRRSTSVDQRPRSSSGDLKPHKKTSPTVEATDSLGGFSFSKGEEVSSSFQNGETLSSSTSTSSRVVSGLARLGERFAKPKDVSSNGDQEDSGFLERPMDELSIVKRSAPIPTRKNILTEQKVTLASLSSSTESEDNSSYPQRNLKTSSRRPSAEDLLAVCIGCALRLSNHEATISTRLAQLNIESDLTLRTAMEGIGEVVDALREVRLRPRGSSTSEHYSGRTVSINAEGSSSFPHPLMDAEESS